MMMDQTGRIACNDSIGENVLCNHAACADDSIIAHGNTGKNSNACAKPDIVANMDWLVVLQFMPAKTW